MLTTLISLWSSNDNEDPISGFLSHDWASVGGWSLFVALAILIVMGSFRETWVPGRRYRRLEKSAEKLSDANDELTKQNGQLITANEITKHFFEETTPKRPSSLEDTQPWKPSNGTFGHNEDTQPKSQLPQQLERTIPRHALPQSDDAAPNGWEPQ